MVTWTSQLAGLHHESCHIVSIRHLAQCLCSLSSCQCCPMRELLWCKMFTAPEETCKRTHHGFQYCSDTQISRVTHAGWLQICFSGMKRCVWKYESVFTTSNLELHESYLLRSDIVLSFNFIRPHGDVWSILLTEKRRCTHLSLHLLRKMPLLSGYSLLQGLLSVRADVIRYCSSDADTMYRPPDETISLNADKKQTGNSSSFIIIILE